MRQSWPVFGVALVGVLAFTQSGEGGGVLIGRVVDDATGKPLAARVYVTGPDGRPYLPPAREGESIAHYDVTRGSREVYAAVGAHPFRVEVPAGETVVTVERGKEYLPMTREVAVGEGVTVEEEFRLLRLFDLASMGWYSGDLHVHTPVGDLPAMQLAEDLNVTFPITAWAHDSEQVPRGARGKPAPQRGELVALDDAHVYWNLNTEYEIFTIKGEAWTLGAILILGHREPFTLAAPPIAPIVEEARKQGALLDWDKHSWPWSTMLVPVAGIDTMELSNNHMWRLKPFWGQFGEPPAEWMQAADDAAGWAEYGFQTYYALLNGGFVLAPSAGTANGVHPVPLGHSRVYVHLDGPFSYEKWLEGLRAGRSFVTNGPALFMSVDGMPPGDRRAVPAGQTVQVQVAVEARSIGAIERIDVIVNGKVAYAFDPARAEGGTTMHHRRFHVPIDVSGASWIAARCFETPAPDNIRFAHTAPVYFDDPTRPIRPEPRQIQFFIDSVQAQIERNRGKLGEAAMAEHQRALEAYRKAAQPAAGAPEAGAAKGGT